MQEIWKDIEGYEGLYQVSNLGQVRSLGSVDKLGRKRKGRIMKQQIHKNGYYSVCLHKDKKEKRWSVHRLVALAFVPNLENKPEVNHIDEDKSNNKAINLEWVTHMENNNYGTKNEKANKTKVERGVIGKRVYCIELDMEFYSVGEAQRCLGVWGISEAARGIKKYAGRHPETNEPLHWKYL